MIDLITLQNQEKLIDGVILHPLKVNRDESGILSELLKTTWTDIYNEKYPFAQCYYSVTPSGAVRDKDLWHIHPTKQEDRFVIIKGDAVVAIYDSRKDSPTFGRLNLFVMGEKNGDNGQYLLLIPQNTLHGFAVVGKSEAVLLNFPTTLYDPHEEGRIPHQEAGVKFSDGSLFTWDRILQEIKV
ncbi:dTDP-4-dehydrorhamnose 3,5-epimerase family protein [Candidatus Roizmanbacteria bacterium]|nr:dTDP-4-dehydrorhamnose 3,5-epimerase family protein [Candidatus Roizmanbacteria bacterium]